MALAIRHKLTLAFASLSLLIAGIAFVAILYSFRSGFLGYLNELRLSSLTQTHQSLSQKIQTQKQWQRLANDRRYWHNIILPSEDENQYLPPPERGPPPIDGSFPPRKPFLLLNANKQSIYGRFKKEDQLLLLPIQVDGQVMGYLGLKKLERADASIDQLFIAQQTRYFIVIIIIACLLSLILAFILARKMSVPLQKLVLAMNRLMKRDYDIRIDYQASDEIGVLAQAFNQLSRSLADNEQSQQQWIADISHELRTPLSTLKGELEALQDGVRQLSIDSIHSLHEDVLRLQKIVDDLHQLSLSDLGAMRYQFDEVPLSSMFNGLFKQHQSQLNGILYDVIDTGAASVYGDRNRLHQLFSNLLQNSIRYTDKPGSIRVTIYENSNCVNVLWEDSAPGVSSDHLDRIFDRLYREEKSRNRQRGGSGLGLSICKAIVDAHGGHILARSTPLGGIAIHIDLPKAKVFS